MDPFSQINSRPMGMRDRSVHYCAGWSEANAFESDQVVSAGLPIQSADELSFNSLDSLVTTIRSMPITMPVAMDATTAGHRSEER